MVPVTILISGSIDRGWSGFPWCVAPHSKQAIEIDQMALEERFSCADFDARADVGAVAPVGGRAYIRNVAGPRVPARSGIPVEKRLGHVGALFPSGLELVHRLAGDCGDSNLAADHDRCDAD